VHVVTVQKLAVVDGDLSDTAWTLYHGCFHQLNALAAQRHLMTPAEFKEVMADGRVTKYVTFDDDGSLAGLSTFTNDLTAVPLIAPEFYQRLWPEHFAQQRIWYIGFVAVAAHARHLGAFAEVFEEFYRTVAPVDGLISLDICLHNESVVHLPRAIRMRLAQLSDGLARSARVDTQSFWVYDLTGATLPRVAA
jgi:hypothetical protein